MKPTQMFAAQAGAMFVVLTQLLSWDPSKLSWPLHVAIGFFALGLPLSIASLLRGKVIDELADSDKDPKCHEKMLRLTRAYLVHWLCAMGFAFCLLHFSWWAMLLYFVAVQVGQLSRSGQGFGLGQLFVAVGANLVHILPGDIRFGGVKADSREGIDLLWKGYRTCKRKCKYVALAILFGIERAKKMCKRA